MIVRYKRNGEIAFYDLESLKSAGRSEPHERLKGPFKSCGECPYPSHGFLCYESEGNCLRTDMEKLHQKTEGRTSDV